VSRDAVYYMCAISLPKFLGLPMLLLRVQTVARAA
jgi:hypothetical protein